MDLSNQKAILRRNLSLLKKQFSAEWRNTTSALILQKVEQMALFQQAQTILLYHSLPDEVQTEAFIEKWHQHKKIILPVVVGDHLVLKPYDPKQLTVGSFSITEPQGDEIADYKEIDLVLVPGVAFDRKGGRIGRGKGFYDRLLVKLNAPKWAIAFNYQLVDLIPMENHDIPLNGVITEQECIIR